MVSALRLLPGCLIAAVAAALLLILVHWFGLLRPIDDRLYDLSLRLRGPRPADARIVVVAVDEETLARYGPWPICRSLYADLLERLTAADAVAFDILFTEPTEEDEAFGRRLRAHGRTVLPVYLDRRRQIMAPVAPLHAAAATGHVHLETDVDGILRRVYHYLRIGSQPPLPSLSAALYALTASKAAAGLDELGSPPLVPPDGLIAQGGQMGINFYGGADAIATVSLLDAIEGRCPPETFRGKIVLVGGTAEGIETQLFTPFNQDRRATPGVCIHAQILGNLLDGSAIESLPTLALYATTLFFVIGGLLFLRRFSPERAAVVWLGATAGIAIVAGLLLAAADFWTPPAILMGALSCAFVLGYIARLLDAGARLASAKRDWQDVFDTIDDAITVHGPDGRLVRINRAAESFGQWLAPMLSERCKKILSELEEGVPSGGEQQPYIEQIQVRGEDRHLEIKTLLRRDAAGRLAGLVQVARDISAQLRMEAEQEALQRHSVQSQKMEALGAMAGGIAHDFNNLLSSMTGYASLAAMDLTPDHPAGRSIANIQKVCERARELVGQILNFSRRRKPKPVPVQPAAMVGEILRLMRVTLPKTIVLRTDLRSEAFVLAEPTQIHQVLLNLCTNAGHAMRPKGGTLSIEMQDIELTSSASAGQPGSLSPGAYVKMSLSDTGKGIPPEIVDKIFRPFFTTKPEGEGTGMGLSVVHDILKRIGGAITVESHPGRGSRFDVFLPVAKGVPKEASAACPSVLSVLVVDDEPLQADLFSDMLKPMGNAVTVSESGRRALEMIRTRPDRFDGVIVELDLPGFPGTRLAEEIRAIVPRLPIIACTGFGAESVSTSPSISAWIKKPLVAEEVAAALKALFPPKAP